MKMMIPNSINMIVPVDDLWFHWAGRNQTSTPTTRIKSWPQKFRLLLSMSAKGDKNLGKHQVKCTWNWINCTHTHIITYHITYHISHITYHISHITLSPITYHISHYHLLPITYHISHITSHHIISYHIPHIMNHISYITYHISYIISYIISYHISYHIIYHIISYHITYHIIHHIIYHITSRTHTYIYIYTYLGIFHISLGHCRVIYAPLAKLEDFEDWGNNHEICWSDMMRTWRNDIPKDVGREWMKRSFDALVTSQLGVWENEFFHRGALTEACPPDSSSVQTH